MADTIRNQILVIRATEETNMFNIPYVQQMALYRGFYELVAYFEDSRQGYVRFILTGEDKEPGRISSF